MLQSKSKTSPSRTLAEGPEAPDGKGAETARISYQGEPGANSHAACRQVFPDLEPMPCPTFEDALAAVKSRVARYTMSPIENSVAGRVADIHHLLPDAISTSSGSTSTACGTS